MTVPDHLKDRLEAGKVIPFVGAGVSLNVTRHSGERVFPTWPELLDKGAGALEAEGQKNYAKFVRISLETGQDLAETAQKAREELGFRWYDFLQSVLDPDFKEIDPASLKVPQLVWQIANELVITTNFDNVLKWSAVDKDNLKILGNNNRVNIANLLRDGAISPTIWHLHGTIDEPEDIILTKSDYDKFYSKDNNNAGAFGIRSLFASHTLLFIGFSFRDHHFSNNLNWIIDLFGDNIGHYALVKQDEVRDFRLRTKNIKTIPFPEYGESFAEILHELSNHSHTFRDRRRKFNIFRKCFDQYPDLMGDLYAALDRYPELAEKLKDLVESVRDPAVETPDPKVDPDQIVSIIEETTNALSENISESETDSENGAVLIKERFLETRHSVDLLLQKYESKIVNSIFERVDDFCERLPESLSYRLHRLDVTPSTFLGTFAIRKIARNVAKATEEHVARETEDWLGEIRYRFIEPSLVEMFDSIEDDFREYFSSLEFALGRRRSFFGNELHDYITSQVSGYENKVLDDLDIDGDELIGSFGFTGIIMTIIMAIANVINSEAGSGTFEFRAKERAVGLVRGQMKKSRSEVRERLASKVSEEFNRMQAELGRLSDELYLKTEDWARSESDDLKKMRELLERMRMFQIALENEGVIYGTNKCEIIERGQSIEELRRSISILEKATTKQKVMRVEDRCLDDAANLMREIGVVGTLKNLSGTKRISIRKRG